MPSPIFPLRLHDDTKARWLNAARGQALAEFIKQAVEEKISRLASDPEYEITEVRIEPPPTVIQPDGGKVFKGPDWKGGKKK